MSEWLDLMLEEIRRKKRESREAEEEAERRTTHEREEPVADRPNTTQSK